MADYVAVRVKDHPAKVTVYNLHTATCRYATAGDPEPTTIDAYKIGRPMRRADVPPSTGWEFGRNAAGGDPDAPAWLTGSALRFTCGHCLRGKTLADF